MSAFLKSLLAAPLVLSFSPDTLEIVRYPLVHQVICDGGRGTAFRIRDSKFISVAHVTSAANCSINGMPITGAEEPGDFATLEVSDGMRGGFPINCNGFVPGEYYFAIGYAGGHPVQRMAVLRASWQKSGDGQRYLIGYPTVIPGMSGGPVLNAKGEVVGTVNTYNKVLPLSGSRELKDTSVCKGVA